MIRNICADRRPRTVPYARDPRKFLDSRYSTTDLPETKRYAAVASEDDTTVDVLIYRDNKPWRYYAVYRIWGDDLLAVVSAFLHARREEDELAEPRGSTKDYWDDFKYRDWAGK